MEDDDDMEIPAHLPPKQREMFMRIKQHTMKLKREKSEQMKQVKKEPEAAADDKIKSMSEICFIRYKVKKT